MSIGLGYLSVSYEYNEYVIDLVLNTLYSIRTYEYFSRAGE